MQYNILDQNWFIYRFSNKNDIIPRTVVVNMDHDLTLLPRYL